MAKEKSSATLREAAKALREVPQNTYVLAADIVSMEKNVSVRRDANQGVPQFARLGNLFAMGSLSALYSIMAFYSANQAPEIKIGHILDVAAPAVASVIAFQEKISEMRESEPLFNVQDYNLVLGILWLLTGLGNFEIGNLISASNFTVFGLIWLSRSLFLPLSRPKL